MKQNLNIGIIVADDTEYAPIQHLEGYNLKEQPYFNRLGHRFTLKQGNRTLTAHSVYCGIGKVNAATAATHLAEQGCKVLLNFGLSGGVGKIPQGSFALGTAFIEHDFDLTVLGRPRGQKPGQPLFSLASEELVQLFLAKDKTLYTGPMACGDCFVSNSEMSNWLREELQVIACDMETAAIASVANLYGIPMACLRQVSDNADDTAATDYKAQAEKEQVSLFEKFMQLLPAFFEADKLWED